MVEGCFWDDARTIPENVSAKKNLRWLSLIALNKNEWELWWVNSIEFVWTLKKLWVNKLSLIMTFVAFSDKKVIDLEKPMRCGAFVDRSRIPQYTEQDYNLPENPPFSWLLRKPKSESESKTDDEKLSKSQNDENSSPNNLNSRIADASKLSQSPKDNVSGTSPSSFKSRWSVRENKEDDKLLKELVSSWKLCFKTLL